MASHSRVANGTILPSRFVKLDTTANGKVLAAGASDVPWGISQPGTRRTPYGALDDGNAAIAGDNLNIYGLGETMVLLELGGTVTVGDFLKPSTNGVGITASADGDIYGAKALRSGVSGELIPVEVIYGFRGA